MRLLKAICCAAAVTVLTVPPAHADEWNKKTLLTFSGPVQIPGKTLDAGTYMFKLADLQSNRHVLQIFDKNGNKLIATLLTVPDYKLEPAKDNVVMFSERPAGSPPAIKAWFYPAATSGDEFVYPRSQAIMIAKASHVSVLARNDEGTTEESMKGATIARVNENDDMADNTNPTQMAANNPPPAPSSVGTAGQTTPAPRTTLPRTASSLALGELLSVLFLLGFVTVRQLRKNLIENV